MSVNVAKLHRMFKDVISEGQTTRLFSRTIVISENCLQSTSNAFELCLTSKSNSFGSCFQLRERRQIRLHIAYAYRQVLSKIVIINKKNLTK